MIWNPIEYSRRSKKLIFFALDLCILPVCLWLAFSFRLGFLAEDGLWGFRTPLQSLAIQEAMAVLVISAGVIFGARLYRIRLHSFDYDTVLRIAGVALILILVASVSAFYFESEFPRSSAVYYGLLFLGFAVGLRLVALVLLRLLLVSSGLQTPIAIYGAGLAGIQLASSLKRSPEVRPIMFVDDNPALQGLIVSGLRVMPPSRLITYAKQRRIKELLIGIPTLSASRRKALAELLGQYGCTVKVIPSYVDLISGKASVSELRRVTPDELLGRAKVDLNVPEIAKAYAGRSVMVTGAGGSIGSELCRQLTTCKPQKIVLFESNEFNLYTIDKELRSMCDELKIELVPILSSVTDEAAVKESIVDEKIEVIIHAAAYKHVPLVECNAIEGARNNVLGTKIVAEAAAAAAVERFILISTDKAVRPTNIMGGTKRLSELVIGDFQTRCNNTLFSIVRFGNVLGSSGSVVPLFQKQIAAGGPVTVTHKDVTRFFMTIPEAACLVLLAGAYSTGNDLFVLDMGNAVKIMDLARRMIELSGRSVRDENNPDGDIEIDVISLRPGEKLYEELLIDDDSLTDTPHEKILRATFLGLSAEQVKRILAEIEQAVNFREAERVKKTISEYVVGYE